MVVFYIIFKLEPMDTIANSFIVFNPCRSATALTYSLLIPDINIPCCQGKSLHTHNIPFRQNQCFYYT